MTTETILAAAFLVATAFAAALAVLLVNKNRRLREMLQKLSVAEAEGQALIATRTELAAMQAALIETKDNLRVKESSLESKSAEARELDGQLRAALARVEGEQTNTRNLLQAKDEQLAGQLNLIEEARLQLKDTFASTASASLRTVLEDLDSRTHQDHALREQKFLALIKPIGEGLDRLGKRCEDTDKVLAGVQSTFAEQVKSILGASTELSNALHRPHIRGNWGEMTLRNALQEAGLQEAVDYDLQDSQDTDDGRLRADAIIYLPQGQKLVIDCKTPLETFREAVNEQDPNAQVDLLRKHSQGVRKHILALSNKEYQAQ